MFPAAPGVSSKVPSWWDVDGVAVASTSHGGTIPTNDSPLLIGTRLQLPADTFHGDLDEIMIWNRALSQNEVAGLMMGPAATYPFAGDASDVSPNGNIGVIIGFSGTFTFGGLSQSVAGDDVGVATLIFDADGQLLASTFAALSVGSDAADIGVRDDLGKDPELVATSFNGSSGDGRLLLEILQDPSNQGAYLLGFRRGSRSEQ